MRREPLMFDETAINVIPFKNPEFAQPHWESLSSHLSPGLMAMLPGLLKESPDPDAALLMLENLLTEGGDSVVSLVTGNPQLLHYALLVFGHSRFLGETLLRNTDLLQSLVNRKILDQSYSREGFRDSLNSFQARSSDAEASITLARFKRREFVRILLRDVLKIAPLAETTAEISALSDVLVEGGLRAAYLQLEHRSDSQEDTESVPFPGGGQFSVISLGKLGGNELNYSSDIDLVYVYRDLVAESGSASLARSIKLAQYVTDILSRVTSEGPVFRIDLRLRPRGGDGELAVSLDQALHYYTNNAEDWERQALIKARHSAGDVELSHELIQGVQPYVYTERVNFSAIKTALVTREKMDRRTRQLYSRDSARVDVKLDHGGIRDIEFLVQCLQRVYGGAEPWLRSHGTLFALQKLHDKGHLSGSEFQELSSAYEFLRHLEHRLQLRHGLQTHVLPSSEAEMLIIRKGMANYTYTPELAPDLADTVRKRMDAVSEIYKRVIFHQQEREGEVTAEWDFGLRSGVATTSSDEPNSQLARLASDSPDLFEIATRLELSSTARKNLFRFLSAAFASSERYAALIRQPAALGKALPIFDASEFLTEILIRHPEEIATMETLTAVTVRPESSYLFAFPMSSPRRSADPVFDYIVDSTVPNSEKLTLLRRHYQHRVFESGVSDLLGVNDVYNSLSMATAVAEDAIAAALSVAGYPPGLAIMALGRLGTGEFDICSDADLLFVCGEDADAAGVLRAVEGMVQALSSYTQDGRLFAVDARLRPRGAEGELLVTVPQLEAYFEREAKEWEALLYTKLRFLAGSRLLADRVLRSTEVLFRRFANDPGVLPAVVEMRKKLDESSEGEKNFKAMPGGTYDVDFITSYLLVAHGIREKNGTLRDRLWRCADSGLLEKREAARLDHGTELLRTTDHVSRLVTGRAGKWLPSTEHARKMTEQHVARIVGRSLEKGIETELVQTCADVRTTYCRIMGAG